MMAPGLGPAQRYQAVLSDVAVTCERAGRDPAGVTVVAVSKTQPSSAIQDVLDAGCLDFGENRVRDFSSKADQLTRRIRWHFIGHLQRNKVKLLVDRITLVHGLDSEGLIEAFERRASSPQDVLIEVNLGDEPQKSGVRISDAFALALRCCQSPIVRPVGLMCIPPHCEDPEDVRPFYRRLADLAQDIREQLMQVDEMVARDFVHLSMGMTNDYSVAIEEGATLIRVGTRIFGPRVYGGGHHG